MSGAVLHLSHVDEWAESLRTGWLDRSTRGLTLADVGFIHTCAADQIVGVAESFYADDPEPLLLLIIDVDATEAAGSALRWEPVPGVGSFPHVFGPIPAAAVVAALPVGFDEHGRFVLPDLTGYDVLDSPS